MVLFGADGFRRLDVIVAAPWSGSAARKFDSSASVDSRRSRWSEWLVS